MEKYTAGVSQGSVLEPLLFLIYINGFPNGIKSTCKISADNTSLFSKVQDKNFSDIFLVQLATIPKHVRLILDSKLDFNEHLDNKFNKCNKMTGIMKRLALTPSRKSLPTICKSFFRPNLDYADIIYDNL